MQTILAHFAEELLIALLPPEKRSAEHACAIDSEQSPHAIELASEDLEHDERKAELPERGSDVCALYQISARSYGHYLLRVRTFEGPLSSSDLYELI